LDALGRLRTAKVANMEVRDQSAPFIGATFIDVGGLGASSYDAAPYFLTLD